ncbi:MAG TPA: hypothetical protein VFY78_09370 [Gammaproteobacteria bacterium]|nr:hypothetical protein [Gammaproteobacteria bacterium]
MVSIRIYIPPTHRAGSHLPPPLCLSQQALGGAGLLVYEGIQEQYVALRLRVRVYVMVVRHEK